MRKLLVLFLERFRGFGFVEGGFSACAFAEKALYLKNMNKYAVRFSSSPIL